MKGRKTRTALPPAASDVAPAAPAVAQPAAEGAVRKVDPATGKFALRHGLIANLDISP